MCLSTVYKIGNGEPELLYKNVQRVTKDEDGETLIFTDLMGATYSLKGRIVDIDLIGNTIDVTE